MKFLPNGKRFTKRECTSIIDISISKVINEGIVALVNIRWGSTEISWAPLVVWVPLLRTDCLRVFWLYVDKPFSTFVWNPIILIIQFVLHPLLAWTCCRIQQLVRSTAGGSGPLVRLL